jgi:alpha-tubulin suppressor-like RCC1 family protein
MSTQISDYQLNLEVNNFLYTGLNIPFVDVPLVPSGFPSGLIFESGSQTISGSTYYTGNFTGYIYYTRTGFYYQPLIYFSGSTGSNYNQSTDSGVYSISFNILPPKNLGYIYSFGADNAYSKSSVPVDFQSLKVKSASLSNDYSLVVQAITGYVPPFVPTPIPTPTPTPTGGIPICSSGGAYLFVIKNKSNKDCIDNFTLVSTKTGSCLGYLENNLSFVYSSGTLGASCVSAMVCSGFAISAGAPIPTPTPTPTPIPIYIPSGYNPPYQCSPVSMSAGGRNTYHSLAVLLNGTITGWGDDTYGQISQGYGLTGVVKVNIGESYSLALLNNGRVTGWGDNTYNRATGGNNLTGVIDISAGWRHSLALLNNGTVVGWGDNTYGQVSAGNILTGVKVISAGDIFSLAVLNNGNVTGWGNDNHGCASAGNALTNAVSVSAGIEFGLALLSDGTMAGWGYNSWGQANGTSTYYGINASITPAVIINGLTGVTAISAGSMHGMALLNNRNIVSWGENASYVVSNASSVTGAVSISAGERRSLALLANGRITGWGIDSYGQSSSGNRLIGIRCP